MERTEGVLILENGGPDGKARREFRGTLLGAPVSAGSIRRSWDAKAEGPRDKGAGELVFNTSMTGYQEILTDPSYYCQIVCMTTPHIGNTGVNPEDVESLRPWAAGFVVHEAARRISNWRSKGDLDSYLREAGIPGIEGVDTRALTRRLRSAGVTRAVILPLEEAGEADTLFKEMPAFEGRDLIREVTTPKPYRWTELAARIGTPEKGHLDAPVPARGSKDGFKVVTLDFGVKFNSLRSLHALGCDVEVVPADTPAEAILERKPDGVYLSNGPGDPSAIPYAVDAVQGLLGKVPVFGICMGHQVLSLACGARTYKLKFGHHGGNQPVLDHESGQVEISSQNHGYAVDADSLPDDVEVTHVNLNDKTVEGIRVVREGIPAFSVQYHPEACPGPHDSMILFNRFIEIMRKHRD